MIHCFPLPYQDEVLWSVVARYADRFRQRSQTSILAEVFGAVTTTPTIDFPGRLAFFANALPPGYNYSVDDVIQKHTSFRWYAPFIPAHRRDELKSLMLDKGGGETWAVAGMVAGRVSPPEHLRVCPHCLRDDMSNNREVHWRRLFQFAGIEVCPQHGVFLEESRIDCVRRFKRTRFDLPDRSLANATPRTCKDECLLRLARMGDDLLGRKWPTLGLGELRSRYLDLLLKNGYARKGKCLRVDVRRLGNEIAKSFPSGLLTRLECHSLRWIEELVRKNNSAQAPIYHLLLLTFLETELEQFFHVDFGPLFDLSHNPPNLTCFNSVCPKRNTPTAKYQFSKLCKPTGMIEFFRCETCGQIQQRCPEGNNRVWVRDYGFLFKQTLQSLWLDPSKSYRDMMRTLDKSADTIKSQAIKQGLPLDRPGKKRSSIRRFEHLTISKAEKRQAAVLLLRKKWSAVMRKHPFSTVRKIRVRAPAIYAALYRYDAEWLKDNQPKGQRWWPKNVPRIDWGQRDEVLAKKVADVARTLSGHGPKPKQPSMAALAQSVGLKAWMSDRLARLPKTKDALRSKGRAIIKITVSPVKGHMHQQPVLFDGA